MVQKQTSEISIVYFGTPPFAATILDALHHAPDVHVKAVITQPDRPSGRGRVCRPSAVKEAALLKGYPVLQPESLKSAKIGDVLRSYQADVFVVAAYGLLLPRTVLDIPRLVCLNIHASLLPKYRGAAPIQAALRHGDRVTGITIMRMVEALDAGPMLMQRALAISIDDTAQTLHDQLAEMGGRIIVEALRGYLCGRRSFIEQDHTLATYAPKLAKNQGQINWDQVAITVHNHIRAMHPWPGAFFTFSSANQSPRKITLHPGTIGELLPADIAPGTLLGMRSGQLAIACKDRAYLVSSLHPSNTRAMDAQSFFCGYVQNFSSDGNLCTPENKT